MATEIKKVRLKDLPHAETIYNDDIFIKSDTLETYKVTADDIAKYVSTNEHLVKSYTNIIQDLSGKANGIVLLDSNGKVDGSYITYGKISGTAYEGSNGKILEDNLNNHLKEEDAHGYDTKLNEYIKSLSPSENGFSYTKGDGTTEEIELQIQGNGNGNYADKDIYGDTFVSMGRADDTYVGGNSFAFGIGIVAYGEYSHAEGFYTTADGFSSHAEGGNTRASGQGSHAEGLSTTASGNYSHAEGYRTYASGIYSHVEGYSTTSSSTIASGQGSHAEGCSTTASGLVSHAEGDETKASGEDSHAEGNRTTASGNYSHAEGILTSASYQSHAEGVGTSAHNVSHAEGNYTIACGFASHAEGMNTKVLDNYSHAEGYKTTANSLYCHAGGFGTSADNKCSTAIGHYNAAMTTGGNYTNTTGTAFVIGNGTSSTGLSNAFSVLFNGTVKAKSTITGSTTADYAEFFEWEDGNPDGEDRVGKFVTIKGDKISIATSNEDYILGIVSGEPFLLGNGDCDAWNGMFLRDEFNRTIMEPAPKVELDEKTGEEKEVFDANGSPVYEGTKPVLNPAYNPDLPYISRVDRQEWAAVGMFGVLSVFSDGTCMVNGYACCNSEGIATACDMNTKNACRVIAETSRKDVVKVIFK